MNKTGRHLGAALLTGAIMIGTAQGAFAAAPVAKIGSTGYKTLSDAIDKVSNGQTIVVQQNIANEYDGYRYGVYDIVEQGSKSYTIDLNGHTITESHEFTDKFSISGILIYATRGAGTVSVTIKNGTIISEANGTEGVQILDHDPSTPTTVTLSNMTIKAAGAVGVSCLSSNLIVQSANITGVNDAIYAEDSDVTLNAGRFIGTGADQDDGAIASYKKNVEDDSVELDRSRVVEPAAPAIIRPSNWKTSPSMDVSVINFEDVKATDWFYSYVYEAAEKGIVSGVETWKFQPNSNVTREQFASILANAAGADLSQYKNTSAYSDVSADKWSAPAIEWARQNDIAHGQTSDKFAPTASITRQEACVMLYKYQKNIMQIELQENVTVDTFPDRDEVASWAEEAVQAMLQEGVMSGVKNGKTGVVNIMPKGFATRAQSCTLIDKLLALSK